MTTAKKTDADTKKAPDDAGDENEDLTPREEREVEEPIIVEGHTAADYALGYRKRELNDGSTDYLCLYDQWTSRDEATMQEHIAAYRSAATHHVG